MDEHHIYVSPWAFGRWAGCTTCMWCGPTRWTWRRANNDAIKHARKAIR